MIRGNGFRLALEVISLVRLFRRLVQQAKPVLSVTLLADELLCCRHLSVKPPALDFLGVCRCRDFLYLGYAEVPI